MKRLPILLGIICLLAGCSKPMIAAFGSNSEIVIVTVPRCQDQAAILQSILEREIQTVQYEKAYQVRVVMSGDVKQERNHKNIILLDYLRPDGLLSDTILGLSGGEKDAFVHISAVERAGLSSLNEGQKVSYELQPGQNGKSSAENLSIID